MKVHMGQLELIRRVLVGLALAWWLVVGAPALAQSAQQQAEILRSLPPDQQKAIMDSLGSKGSGVRSDADLKNPETVRRRGVDGLTNEFGGLGTEGGWSQEYAWLPVEPRIRSLDTVLVEVKRKKPEAGEETPFRTPEELERIAATMAQIEKGNPFRLDSQGILNIPGLPPIPLAGLTEAQATSRLAGDATLRDFDVTLTLLPLEKIDTEGLKPFGYDLFAGVPSTFAPVSDVPVPSAYTIGPGDRFEVQLLGKTTGRYSLVVQRDGRVMFPELGPIAVAGLGFGEAKARIEAKVAEEMIGTQVAVSMGDLRSIRVLVLGEAQQPGSFTVSGLATITNALFASGGVKPIGSLRNIQLKRNGALVRTLDLYDLLLRGDTSDDVRLQDGDVIFIPAVGKTVSLAGEVRRPAIYELEESDNVASLLHLGGGLTPEADPGRATLERVDQRSGRLVYNVNLGGEGRNMALRSGDLLRVLRVRPTYANRIAVEGHVYRPANFEYRAGMHLTDVLPSVEELKPGADVNYVLVRREQPDSQRVEAISADLEAAWRAPRGAADPLLQPRDRVFVFDLNSGRQALLDPLLEELRLQSTAVRPTRVVRVVGQVRVPGVYPLEPGMTVAALLRAGGGLAAAANAAVAEIARYQVVEGSLRRTSIIEVDLQRLLAGDLTADVELEPFDFLVVKQVAEWGAQETVQIIGEVRYPGTYPIQRGETLASVLQRAGGFTDFAFREGSVFTRRSLQERERRQLELLADRLSRDLTSVALQSAQSGGSAAQGASETLAVGNQLLADLRDSEPVGRLVVDLDRLPNSGPGGPGDVIMQDGDILRVPIQSQEVTVIGEVQSPNSHLWIEGLTREDYLTASGGLTQKADSKRIYVVRANGSVADVSGSRWFRSDGSGIRPGDTVVVPIDATRMQPLAKWTAVTTILYNLAIAAAAVNSF